MKNNFGMAVRFVLLLCGQTPKMFTEKGKHKQLRISQQYFTMLLNGQRNNLEKKREIWNELFNELVGEVND